MKKDILFVMVILLIALAARGIQTVTKQQGAEVVVTRNGQVEMTFPLMEDREVLLMDATGQNRLVIKDGRARITEADCPDKICVRQSGISGIGETIVCLPHRLVIEINGAQKETDYDALAK